MAGNRFNKQYQLIESSEFTESLKNLGDVRRLDEILSELMTVISYRPHDFPLVHGWNTIRLAKTLRIEFGDIVIPEIRIHFRIISGQRISLLYIETDEDDIPF